MSFKIRRSFLKSIFGSFHIEELPRRNCLLLKTHRLLCDKFYLTIVKQNTFKYLEVDLCKI